MWPAPFKWCQQQGWSCNWNSEHMLSHTNTHPFARWSWTTTVQVAACSEQDLILIWQIRAKSEPYRNHIQTRSGPDLNPSCLSLETQKLLFVPLTLCTSIWKPAKIDEVLCVFPTTVEVLLWHQHPSMSLAEADIPLWVMCLSRGQRQPCAAIRWATATAALLIPVHLCQWASTSRWESKPFLNATQHLLPRWVTQSHASYGK